MGGSTCDDTHTCATTLLAVRDEMRRLWTDHVAYTRFYIIEAVAGLPQAQVTAQRLLANQDEIGAALKPFYSEAISAQLAHLLREHILGAAAVLAAAQSGDRMTFEQAKASWYANADAIAAFLAKINPNLSLDDLRADMKIHLDQTLAEATARLTGDWDGDVRAFDAIAAHIRDMADMLATGIARQFPDKVSTVDVPGHDLHLQMRVLWEDHVIWTRVVIIDAIAHGANCTSNLPDLQVALAHLLRDQDDIGNAVRPSLGDAVADQLTALLHDHITIAAQLVLAAKANDATAVADLKTRWYQNGNDIALALSIALGAPLFVEENMMKVHLDQTLAEAVDDLTGKFRASIADYDAIVAHILDMADAISLAVEVKVGA